MNKIKAFFYRLLPKRQELIFSYRDPDKDIVGNEADILLPISKAQQACPELFLLMLMRLRAMEKRYHAAPQIKTQDDVIKYAIEHIALGAEIQQLKSIYKAPFFAAEKINAASRAKKETAEKLRDNYGDLA